VKDEIARLAFERSHPKENQLDRVFAWIREEIARDLLAGGVADAEFFFQFAGQRLLGNFAWLHFAAGKFPLERMRLGRRAPAYQNPSAGFENRCHYLDHFPHCPVS